MYVPAGTVEIARRLCVDNQVNVAELWSYHTIADQTRFTLVERSAAAARAEEPRKRTAAAAPRPARSAARPPAGKAAPAARGAKPRTGRAKPAPKASRSAKQKRK